VAVVLGAVLVVGGAPAGRAGGGTGAIDRFVQGRLAATRLPGVAVAVTRGSKVEFLRGYGTGGRGEPITPDTQFRVASLSKSFTAFAVMRLVEAGKIRLDEPVRRYLPGFRLADAAGARITVRELLNQTSGLGDRGFPQITDDETSLAGRVADLRHAHLVGTPGRTFLYCDLNYQVLGRMLEVVSGRPLADVLRREVFGPLGMDGTVAVPTVQDGPRAAPRLAEGSILVYGFPVGRPELHGLLAGSGGVITTARDMTRWLTVQSGGDPRVLGAEAMRTMHTPPPGVNGDYAMGWVATTGPRRLEHTGVLSTFYADQVVLPDSHIGIALLYPAYNGLAATGGIKQGVIALATGHDPPGGRFPDGRAIAALIGVLTLGSIVLRSRALVRLRHWTERAGGRNWRRTLGLTVPGIVWALLPAVLVAALPWLVALVTGRVVTRHQLFRAVPSIEIWWIAAGILGLALGTARIVMLLRFHRSAAGQDARPPGVGARVADEGGDQQGAD
jgi:CubicO group peptidase (beta-lactamase class C family)